MRSHDVPNFPDRKFLASGGDAVASTGSTPIPAFDMHKRRAHGGQTGSDAETGENRHQSATTQRTPRHPQPIPSNGRLHARRGFAAVGILWLAACGAGASARGGPSYCIRPRRPHVLARPFRQLQAGPARQFVTGATRRVGRRFPRVTSTGATATRSDAPTSTAPTSTSASSPAKRRRGVTVSSNYIYWASNPRDRSDEPNSIAPTTTSVHTHPDHPDGVVVNATHIYWANDYTIGRATSTVPTPTSVHHRHRRPLWVSATSDYIYWTHEFGNTIGRANLTAPTSTSVSSLAPTDRRR